MDGAPRVTRRVPRLALPTSRPTAVPPRRATCEHVARRLLGGAFVRPIMNSVSFVEGGSFLLAPSKLRSLRRGGRRRRLKETGREGGEREVGKRRGEGETGQFMNRRFLYEDGGGGGRGGDFGSRLNFNRRFAETRLNITYPRLGGRLYETTRRDFAPRRAIDSRERVSRRTQ